MITFTKEQLIARIKQVTAINKYRIGRDPSADGLAMDNELFAIALASLEAEPVADVVAWSSPNEERICDVRLRRHDINPGQLYTAPPAPVSVPEPIKRNDADGWWVYKGRRVGGRCAEWYNRALDDCRAAMLQGVENAETPTTMQTAPALDSSPKIAESPTGINQGKSEPVTTANKLPFEQWLSQQTGTIDVECGYVMTEVFFHWLRVAYEAGNSPVIPDGWVMVPEEPTHEMLEAGDEQFGTYDVYRRMIAASPQQEVKP
ncbi:hypothetical protein [Enterobacter hormaechei]|uniref:hypothetical protein n=1 Tax=Enterobacter hormaechei TaxID=158836 RepID=UPI00334F1C8B